MQCRRRFLTAVGFGFLLVVSTSSSFAAELEPTPDQLRFFEQKIRPILANNCFQCHGADKQRGSLRLDSLATILSGGESGPAIMPGKPDESLMVEAINYESYEMPPTGKLPDEEIAALTNWIQMGAPWPHADATPAPAVAKSEITDEDRAFWSFQPVANPAVPKVEDHGWARNEIDRFILQRLTAEGLAPAAEADRRTLIRRASFDLTGLPPTPEEVDAFLADSSPQAYENLIDRLLVSPRYGEHWARHWLDLVRYAESDGFKQDAYREDAWRYRDYVIRSLNGDKPYDRFVMEQLAGDEIAPHDPDALVATGFLRHWIYEYNQRDVRTQWSNILNDVTDVTADVFLGLGMGCARCHDHKFDPILQKDYFRLQAFFAPLLPRDDLPLATPEQWDQYQTKLAKWEQSTADIRRQMEEIERPIYERTAMPAINKFPPDIRPMMRKSAGEQLPLEHQLAQLAFRQVNEEYSNLNVEGQLKGETKQKYQELKKQLAELDKDKPQPLPRVLCVTDVGAISPPTIIPGDRKAEPIAPGFLSLLDPSDAAIESAPAASNSTGRRTTLARWLTRPDNPLTTRVIANRIWQYHFGRGLVATSSDFGRLGEPPSHAELLDWLTTQFVQRGWSFKQMHRLIMTSATYRQSALEKTETARLSDPDNRLLWRMNVRRLDAEQIRDAMFAVTGELKTTTGGASVATSQARRTIYTKVLRNTRDPLLEAFDAPEGFASTNLRNVTTTPTQALLMINGDFTLARAKAFAKRLERERLTDEQLVSRAFQLVFARPPEPAEQAGAVEFLEQQSQRDLQNVSTTAGGDARAAALIDFCHVLLNSNEFLYVD